MSFFTHGVVDVWFGGCLVWWMSDVVDVCVVDVVQSLLITLINCLKCSESLGSLSCVMKTLIILF